MASAVRMGPGASCVSRMLLWSVLLFCFSFHFKTEMVVSGSDFTVCGRLSNSMKTFHLCTRGPSCTINLTLSENKVNVYIGDGNNYSNTETIITKNPLSNFCFTWSANMKNYTISSENILNVTGSLDNMSVYRRCENFTLTNSFNNSVGNFSYMRMFNLNSIKFLKASSLTFQGSNTSSGDADPDECEQMANRIKDAAEAFVGNLNEPNYISQFMILMLSNMVNRCGDQISNISFYSRIPLFLNQVTRKDLNRFNRRQVIINNNVTSLIMLFPLHGFYGVSIESNSSLITFNRTETVKNPTIEITINKDVQMNEPFNIVSTLYKGTAFFQGNRNCAFWEFSPTGSREQGNWNISGCTTHNSEYTTQCLCDHLSFFAVLLDVGLPLDPSVVISLEFITLIGCTISAVFLTITIIHYIYLSLKKQIDSFNKIHLNLCISLLFLNIDFLLIKKLSSLHIDWLCKALAISLHYFFLSSFVWMGVEGFHLYLLIIKVFHTQINWYLLKASLIAWGFPAIVEGISFAVNQEMYGYYNISSTNSEICWITDHLVQHITNWGTFGLVFLGNTMILTVTLVKVLQLKRADAQYKQDSGNCKSLCSVLSLSVLLGLTYGVAFFQFGSGRVFILFLFTILNSLQGFFIFLWHCLLTIQARKSKKQNSSTS
uniref:Probable G-protein coupled receptor 114 n=1 Tax=Callorhinchus milii TaxID=7868 RepID=A0A4W3J956_CALMI